MGNKFKLKVVNESLRNINYAYDEAELLIKDSSQNSSATLERTTTLILNHFLSLIIVQAYFYYKINDQEKLSRKKYEILEEIKTNLIKLFSKSEPSDNETTFLMSFMEKHYRANLTRHNYISSEAIVFNDSSNDPSHKKAFSDKRDQKNLLLRITGYGSGRTEIRIGVNVNDDAILLCGVSTK